MRISPVKWKNWDAVRCATDQWELVVGVSAGPRILSFLQPGKPNLLYEDTTGFGLGEWTLYGGHRFTTAPENEDSYPSENTACEWTASGSSLLVKAGIRSNDLQLSLEIKAASDGVGVDILHVLENHGDYAWEGALWAITCFPRTARLEARCDAPELHYWPGAETEIWKRTNGILTVLNSPARAKVGWHTDFPSLTAIQDAGVVGITHPYASTAANCVDNGSNTELFVCSDFMELETLSEKIIVEPGHSASHFQEWRMLTAAL